MFFVKHIIYKTIKYLLLFVLENLVDKILESLAVLTLLSADKFHCMRIL